MLVLAQALRDRRRSTLWWTVAVILLLASIVASYPAARDAASGLDQYLESLPEGLTELLGAAGGLTEPAGYLNSQWYSAFGPMLLLVLGIGMAAWAIGGSEEDGTLEMLLANPVPRARVAAERFAGVVVVLLIVVLVSQVALIATAPTVGLAEGIGVNEWLAVTVGLFLLVLAFSAVTFAVGAATGRRGLAIAVGAGCAGATYLLQALAVFVSALEPLRWLSPWDWFLAADPLADSWAWQLWVLPLAVVLISYAAGVARFVRRDLR